MPPSLRVVRAAALAALLVAAGTVCAQLASDAYEPVPTLRAGDILPPALLRSGQHRVLDTVGVEGDLYTFELDSPYGLYRVRSLAMLRVRVHEVRTLAQAINQYQLADREFADRLRGTLSVGADSFVDILASPFDTATSLAGQLASNIEQTVRELNRFPSPRDEEGQPSPYLDTVTLDPITGAHKRAVASQLDLNVYSSNPRVQEFLNTVARARSAGHFQAGIATIRVPAAPVARVAGGRLESEVKSLLRRLTPDEIDEGVGAELARIGVAEPVIAHFLAHRFYSPRHRLLIATHLDFLHGVDGRPSLVEAALAGTSEADALSFVELARMIALYHERVEPLTTLRLAGALPIAIANGNRVVIALPVDLIWWRRETDRVFAELAGALSAAGHAEHELVLTGTLTDAARRGLEAYGYRFRERFLTDGA